LALLVYHAVLLVFLSFFFQCSGDHRDLHSFPTRRSSDLGSPAVLPALGSAGADGRPDPGRGLLAQGDRGTGQTSGGAPARSPGQDRKSTRLNSSHVKISYAVFCLKKKKNKTNTRKTRQTT